MQHIHQYEYREPQPRNSEPVRDRLRQKPKRTFETVEDAAAWHEKWIGEHQRPPGYWGADGAEAGAARKVAFTRAELERGNEVVDGFWSGEHIAATLIPCPPRVIPGFPVPPPCPLGRH